MTYFISFGQKQLISKFLVDSEVVFVSYVLLYCTCIHSVDLEVWSKLAKRARMKRIASKFACDFECVLQRVNAFSRCVTLTRVLLLQIIFCSDTKVSVLVIECKRAIVINVQSWYFYSILQGQQSIGHFAVNYYVNIINIQFG